MAPPVSQRPRRSIVAVRLAFAASLALLALFIGLASRHMPLAHAERVVLLSGGVVALVLLAVFERLASRFDRQKDRALAAAARAEERFRSLVLAASQIVWTMDADGLAREDSPTWRKATGQTYEQWQGSGWLDAIHPDDRAEVRAAWTAAVAARQPFEMEFRLRTPTGEYRWSAVHAVPVSDPGGAVREWVGMNFDIEERKRAQERHERTARRKDDFLALLAHELRNPLAPLRNGLELLTTGASPEQRPTIEMMRRQFQHLVRLVDDLLDANRIGRGKLVLRRAVVDLAECVEQAAESAVAEFRRAGQRLDVAIVDRPLWVDGDATRLAQIVANLLDNARKFSGRGATTWLRLERVANRARIVVRDAGQGIRAEDLPTVFEPFHERRAPSDPEAASRDPGGLGIGLSLVRSLVQMHGGVVTATSNGPGAGAEFTVWFPTVAAPHETRQARNVPRPRRARPSSVLIVDDNEEAAESLGLLLRLGGHDVRVATRGEEGLAALEERDVELVICDIRMPGMDGLEFARRIRRRGGARPLLVALTGFGDDEDRLRTAAAGFDVHMLKPLDPGRLEQVLRRAAERRDRRAVKR